MTQSTHGPHERRGGHYGRFAAMIFLSFAAMYALMYAMVDRLPNALPNNNQVYMAGLMTAAMAIIELGLMGRMYPKRKWNVLILAISVASLGAFWFAIRQQWAISDRQFLRSMIPHHAGAILMCHEAPIEDPEVRQLCRGIIASQQAEIGQMKAKLETLEGR